MLGVAQHADTLRLSSIHEQVPGPDRAVAENEKTLRRLRAEHGKLVKKVGETRFTIERDVVANASVVATTSP